MVKSTGVGAFISKSKLLLLIIIASVLSYITKKLNGCIFYQLFFEKLHKIALRGMNYGRGDDISYSGERFIIQKVLGPLREKTIIFDVGANVGNYSRLVVECLGDANIEIFSFEPSKATYRLLKKNTADISCIHTFNTGLGSSSRKETLYSDKNGSVLASIYDRRLGHHGIQYIQSETVSIVSLDGFCEEHSIDRIRLLKIDTEGNELDVLMGASGMRDQGRIDFIQFEFGGCNIDSRTFFQDFHYLLNDKFKIFRILADGLEEIENYNERHEIFLTTNYLAARRQ